MFTGIEKAKEYDKLQATIKEQAEEIEGLKAQIRIMKIENKTLLTALKQEQALSQKEPRKE